MGALLLNYTNLGMRVYDPVSGEVRQYANGKLEIEEDDPCYAAVLKEGMDNPDTKVFINNKLVSESYAYACDVCRPAQTFDSKAELKVHTDLVHLAKPVLDAEGNAAEEAGPVRRHRKGEAPTEIPPATAGRGA